jgi:hypothetical protein
LARDEINSDKYIKKLRRDEVNQNHQVKNLEAKHESNHLSQKVEKI